MKTITKKITFLLLFLLMLGGESWGQTTVFEFNFNDSDLVVDVENAVGTPTFSTVGTLTGPTYNTCNGNAVIYSGWDANDALQMTVSTTGFTNLEFSYVIRASNVNVNNFKARASLDGTTWTDLEVSYIPTTGCVARGVYTLGVGFNNQATVFVQLFKTNNAGNAGNNIRFDDAKLVSNPTLPTLLASPTSLALGSTPFGTASASQSYVLSGSALTGFSSNIVLTAPTGFEISLNNSTFSATLNVPYTSATLASTTIYARITSSAGVGAVSGNITHTGGGIATTFLVPLTGTVTPITPTLTATPTSLTGFSTTLAVVSVSQSYVLTGINLTGFPSNIVLTAPAGFEISLNNVTFSSTLNVPYTSATLSSVSIYVHLTGATLGVVSGNITHVGGGVSPTYNMAVSGNVNPAGGTIFLPGDLMFVGFDNQSSTTSATDKISIVTLVDMTGGTEFVYANAVYELGANANERTRKWYACNGDATNAIESFTITYTGATIPKGTVICFEVPTAGGPNNASFTTNGVVSTDFTSVRSANTVAIGGANMSTGGPDAVFLMQGTWTNNTTYSTFSGKILGGIQQGGAWYNITNDLSSLPAGTDPLKRRSRIPPEIECFAVQATTTVGLSFAYYSGTKTGTQPVVVNNIIDFTTNWTDGTGTTGDNIPAAGCNTGFTVSGLGTAGRWTGAANTNWFNCRNWENLSVPDKNVNVTISATATNNPTISSTAPSADTYFAFSDLAQRVAECNNITIDRLNLVLEGNNTPANRLDIYGNLTITGTGGLDMADAVTSTPDGLINLSGNWVNNLTTTAFQEGNGTINFLGVSPQNITTTGGTETFDKVILNNNAGLSLSNTNMLLSNNLTFTNGIITANNATTARVEFLAGSGVTGAGTGKYVAGFVRKVGNTAFDFPVGDENYYALARISAPTSATDHFTATYDRVSPNPYNPSAIKNEGALTLNHVDYCEYWDIQRTNGASNVFVTLAYEDTRSCKITNGLEADMRIAHWDGTQWENNGNSATNVISSTYGTITSGTAISTFSPFTLGSISIFNPLPIEIVSFTAKINQNNHAQLDWVTVSEINAQGFEIEKSFDGKSFEKIGYQNALGGVDVIKNYQFFDKNFKDAAYYRLKMIDNDKSFRYSRIIYLNNQKTNNYELTIIPNPTQGEVKLVLGNALPTENVTLKVFSITGKEVISLFGNVLEVEKQLSNQTIKLPAGMYVVRMQIAEQILQTKLIKN